jgi:putative restriction endonuclease
VNQAARLQFREGSARLNPEDELRYRVALADAVEDLVARNGGFATRDDLVRFRLNGQPAQVMDFNRGIWNPVSLGSTLSVVSDAHQGGPIWGAGDRTYGDRINMDTGLLEYSFQDGDPTKGTNAKLRRAIETGMPVIVLRKYGPNFYVPIFPSYVVAEDLDRGIVFIAMDETIKVAHELGSTGSLKKGYVERVVQQRVHQPMFRARVMHAYTTTLTSGNGRPACAICRLQHPELLDAAHIIADSQGGSTEVTNGIALCKIHHAAYDENLLGISPDYQVHVNRDLLEEVDGPMLKHGIQEMHLSPLTLPKRKDDWPSQEGLDFRFEVFAR